MQRICIFTCCVWLVGVMWRLQGDSCVPEPFLLTRGQEGYEKLNFRNALKAAFYEMQAAK
jgi:hypothetical protein